MLTDGQDDADMACQGDPRLKTPNLDRLYAEGVRLEDYRVGAACTPTRGADDQALLHARRRVDRDSQAGWRDATAWHSHRSGPFHSTAGASGSSAVLGRDVPRVELRFSGWS